jgi:hypothetical protein
MLNFVLLDVRYFSLDIILRVFFHFHLSRVDIERNLASRIGSKDKGSTSFEICSTKQSLGKVKNFDRAYFDNLKK